MSYYQRKAADGSPIPNRWEAKVYFGKRQIVRRARTEREAKRLERQLLNERNSILARIALDDQPQLPPPAA